MINTRQAVSPPSLPWLIAGGVFGTAVAVTMYAGLGVATYGFIKLLGKA